MDWKPALPGVLAFGSSAMGFDINAGQLTIDLGNDGSTDYLIKAAGMTLTNVLM